MATPTQPCSPFMSASHNDEEKCNKKISHKLIPNKFPRERGWLSDEDVHLFNGFWYLTWMVDGIISLQKHFKPNPNDVLLATHPKSGTTWLKAVLFAILNRATYNLNHDDNSHPLLTSNPHELVPVLESYASTNPTNPRPESSLFHTHLAYQSLPQQMCNSSCRIVYVFRDPKDVFVSYWHFLSKVRAKDHLPSISLQEAFDQFCRGASPYGPYWDHVTGYYKASVRFPDKVFFVRYEDLKTKTVVYVKRLAEFLGKPFSAEEENERLVEKIIYLCSFEKLSNLEVNTNGSHDGTISGKKITIIHNLFFRKGEIGDSKNYLTQEMREILDQITEDKFKEFGLPTFVPPVKTE